jgi:pyruvate, orthophosphate dikinase
VPVFVYEFARGDRRMRDLLGGKGANLAEMTAIGLPVPDGFTITTEACLEYLRGGERWPDDLREQVDEALDALEKRVGKTFGAGDDPLLVSVRSGSPVSMPGMMDTILNLGLNDRSVQRLAEATGDERFALDSYRRLIAMFGDVVAGAHGSRFEDLLTRMKAARGAATDVDLDAGALRELVGQFKRVYEKDTGEPFPEDPRTQLDSAIEAVFRSWNTPRAVAYRRREMISDEMGTAVNVQQMVFGNVGEDSGTGVAFTRNPSTGAAGPYGEFLVKAQGEDVVSGARTAPPLTELERVHPEAYTQLIEAMRQLERHYGDMQDVEFTVERGRLYMLQTRSGKRDPRAALRIALDLVGEGVTDRGTALRHVDANQLENVLRPTVSPRDDHPVIATGLPACAGAAVGVAVFDSAAAQERAEAGDDVILIRAETSAEDVPGMARSVGVVTSRGGMTSHAAVVVRGWGTPCVVGAEALHIDTSSREASANGHVVHEGDTITVSVTDEVGRVILGAAELVPPPAETLAGLRTITSWADDVRRLGVRANADTPEDAAHARELGAEGIGLCRTEHMFFSDRWLPVVRRMIMAHTVEERRKALDELLPPHQADFEGILEVMHGLPVTIRLLDPPLHEFVPDVPELHEVNPMLGTRGCRLGVVHPEIYEMQVRAIVRAAKATEHTGVEIMHPLVAFATELRRLRELTERVIEEEKGGRLGFHIGTMIEVPRAALTANEIAHFADFCSFGTNDLTQMTLAFSRDDAENGFLPYYLDARIMPTSPFETLDQTGVGQLVEMAVRRARETRPTIKLGVCGEHGGDPNSIDFFHRVGLDYVSCSPNRVPTARLAAAQAVLEHAG